MICKFCDHGRRLIKAHIIPQAFFRDLQQTQGDLKIRSGAKGDFPKKAPIGIYDKTILCAECEKSFQRWDDYGIDFLLKQRDYHKPVRHEGRILYYQIQDFDYVNLMLFFISIIWRAAVSSHLFYSKVTLGPHEFLAKDILKSNGCKGFRVFSVALCMFEGQLGKTIFEPFRDKFEGFNFLRLYLSGFMALIKTDKRPGPDSFRNFFIRPSIPIRILVCSLKNSKELKTLHSIKRAAIQTQSRSQEK